MYSRGCPLSVGPLVRWFVVGFIDMCSRWCPLFVDPLVRCWLSVSYICAVVVVRCPLVRCFVVGFILCAVFVVRCPLSVGPLFHWSVVCCRLCVCVCGSMDGRATYGFESLLISLLVLDLC